MFRHFRIFLIGISTSTHIYTYITYIYALSKHRETHKHIINYNLCICQITYKCTSPRLQIDTSNKRLVSKLKTIFPNTNNNPLWNHCEGGDLPAGVVAHVLHWILWGIDGIGEVSGLGTNWFGMVGWIYKGWLSDKFCIFFSGATFH